MHHVELAFCYDRVSRLPYDIINLRVFQCQRSKHADSLKNFETWNTCPFLQITGAAQHPKTPTLMTTGPIWTSSHGASCFGPTAVTPPRPKLDKVSINGRPAQPCARVFGYKARIRGNFICHRGSCKLKKCIEVFFDLRQPLTSLNSWSQLRYLNFLTVHGSSTTKCGL